MSRRTEDFKTVRQSLFEELLSGMKTIRYLSQTLRISEKEVLDHLVHIEKSAKNRGCKFIMKPPACQDCNFIFEKRERPRKPGRCPKCKSEFISNPEFGLEKLGGD